MKIEFKQIRPHVYHARFDTRYELTSSMLRFGEYYESPKFRGKPFTVKQFKKWYMESEGKKKFTYYQDWSGYNIPSKEFKPFTCGDFDPLTRKEKKVLSLVKNIEGRFYFIATFKGDKYENDTINHETTHAIYHVNKEYKKKVLDYLYGKDLKEIKKFLLIKGYSQKPRILLDEINAYLVNDLEWLRRKGVKGNQYSEYSKNLIKIRNPYW